MAKENNTVVENELSDFEIPNGFNLVSDGDLTDEWDYEENPTLTGTVLVKKIVEVKRQKKVEQCPMLIVDGVGGPVVVWESASLKDLISQAEPGDAVYIHYRGLQHLDGGRNPMKVFATGIKKRQPSDE